MAVRKTKTKFHFNSLTDSDRFSQHYFIFHDKSISCAWGPPQVFIKHFLSSFQFIIEGSTKNKKESCEKKNLYGIKFNNQYF